MKSRILILLWLVAGICQARADLSITQTVEGMGQNAETTSRFKGGKARVDTSPGASLIMDLQTGETITLTHPQKTYLKISGDLARAAIESIKQTQGEHPDARSPLTATGREETINGHAAAEYTCTVAGVKTTLWLTRDLPDYQVALREMSAAMKQGALAAVMQNYGFDLGTLPGFPVRTVLELPSGGKTVRTVTAVSTATVPDSEFRIPEDYQETGLKTLTPPVAVKPLPTP